MLIILTIIFIMTIKYFKFCLLSFIFDSLNENEWLGKFLGIKYVNDYEYCVSRENSQIYMPGLFSIFFEYFTGMPLRLNNQTLKLFLNIQNQHSNKINLSQYLQKLKEKKIMTIEEFENIMSKSILTETNRVFHICDKETEKKIESHLLLLRKLISHLTGGGKNLSNLLYKHWWDIIELSKLLKTLPEEYRLFVFVPQLTLLNSFTQMIVDCTGDLKHMEASDFLKPVSKYMVMIEKGQLIFVRRFQDKTNNFTNKAFGVEGFQCPGKKYTFKVIQSVLDLLRDIEITIVGNVEYSEIRQYHSSHYSTLLVGMGKAIE